MKRHLRLSNTGQEAHELAASDLGAEAFAATAPRSTHLTLVQTRPWNHTLILRGCLDERSAAELEDEIECLREEGVSSLVLDLRELDAVEPGAMQVIASQQAWFRSCGRRFAVLTGATARNGAGGSRDGVVRPFVVQAPADDCEMSTTMIRELGSD
jgi:anti-anti-sigma regulatory factor